MRAIVTGATGFIGNHLVRHLARLNWEVTCLVRRPVVSLVRGVESIPMSGFSVQDFDCFFHLAAATSLHDLPGASIQTSTSRFWEANAQETMRLLELAELCRTKSFIYTSTQLVIGKPQVSPFRIDHPLHPETPYALSKLAGEQACQYFLRADRVPATILRLSSVIGCGMREDSVLPRFVKQALRSEDLAFHGTGARVQNFVHLDDVIRALVLTSQHPPCAVLNIGGASSLSMKDLAELVLHSLQNSASRVRPSGEPDPQEDYRWMPDLQPARETLGYSPCITVDSFVPGYARSLTTPAPVDRWWREP